MSRLAALIFLVLASLFFVRKVAKNDPVFANSDVRYMEQVKLKEESEQRIHARRERARVSDIERKTALDLAERIAKNYFAPNRMLYDDEEHLPSDLVKESARMEARQLRMVVLSLTENPEIAKGVLSILVVNLTDAWLREHKSESKQALEQMLEIIAEVLPMLPTGQNILPVSNALSLTLEWDVPLWVDFMENHWDVLNHSDSSFMAEGLRRDVLAVVDDPQLRTRLDALPRAGNSN